MWILSLCSGGEPQADDVPEFIIRQAPERIELDKYAESQWEVNLKIYRAYFVDLFILHEHFIRLLEIVSFW